MANQGWHRLAARVIGTGVAVIALTAGLSGESHAQVNPLLKIKVDVSPSVGILLVEPGVQILITEELEHLEKLMVEQTGGSIRVSFGPGFSISTYENVSVLVSIMTPEQMSDGKDSANAPQITCGYLNDGTTYFRRATITNKSAVQFRLRNNGLLRRSMKLEVPLFVAYVFFVINEQKGEIPNGNSSQVSTVTVEFM